MKTEEKMEYLSKCKTTFRAYYDARRRYDYEWMVRDLYRRGYHFSRYQPSTQTVTLASRQTAKVPVNLIAAQIRSIRNQVTSFRPKFECLPRYMTQESKTQARYDNRLLDYIYDHLNFKTLIKKTVTQGLMFSIGGPWQIYYDPLKKEVRVWMGDPFDFYFDPLAEQDEDCEGIIKAVRRPLAYVLTNPNFDEEAKKEIHGGEGKLASSEYKQFMIQALKSISQYQSDTKDGLILYEGSFKIYDEDTGKPYIRNLIWTDQNTLPLYWEDTDNDEYDYCIYHADLNPNEILGEGWMRHTLPINRVIDSLESSVFDYNYRVAKGRIVVDRDSGVRAIHNVHGEIVEKNRGAEVRALDMPSLPVATSLQIDRMNRYIEDIGGVHDASLGRVPAGVKAGIGIAELKQSDSTSQDDLVDNLEDFLSEVGRKILKKISKNYKTYQVIKALGYREEDSRYFAVIGSGADKAKKKDKIKVGPDLLDLAVIGEDNNVRVTIGSWLGYTKEAMQEKVLKLAQAGLIDQKTFLQLWEFGSIDDIVQQTRVEMLLKKQINTPNQQGQVEPDQFGLAMTENEMIVNEGKDVPVDTHDDHLVHMAVHQEAIGRGNDELLQKHMDTHQIYMAQPGSSAPDQGQDQLRNQQVQGQQPPNIPGPGGPVGMPNGMGGMTGGPPQGGSPAGGQMPPVGGIG